MRVAPRLSGLRRLLLLPVLCMPVRVREGLAKLRVLRPRLHVPKLPARVRRLFPYLAFVLAVLLVLHLYARLRLYALHCGRGSSWTCRALNSDGGDAKPIVGTPKGVSSPSVFGGGAPAVLDDVNSALEDAYYAVADSIHNPAISIWTHGRDSDDVSMSRRQCMLAFPGLFAEIDRARSRYEQFSIAKVDVERIVISSGRLRAGIFSGKVHILETNLRGQKDRTRALAILRSLNEAISNSKRTQLPDIEFVVSVNPQVADLTTPIWTPDRREEDDKVWLMPDTGYVVEEVESYTGAPPTGSAAASDGRKAGAPTTKKAVVSADTLRKERIVATPRKQLIADIEEVESALPYDSREMRLVGVWRASQAPDNARKKGLVHMAEGQDWAESADKTKQRGVVGIEGTNATSAAAAAAAAQDEAKKKQAAAEAAKKKTGAVATAADTSLHLTPLSDMCKFAFLAHDSSFPISVLDGPILCGSVLLTTRPKWQTIYSGLMLANPDHMRLGDAIHPVVRMWGERGAGKQNVVLVADDWGDLDMKVRGLLEFPDAAKTIAANAVESFRHRYLTPSATACYWRELVLAYGRVAFTPRAAAAGGKDVEVEDDGKLGRRTWEAMRGISVESFLLLDDDTQMSFNEAMMH